MTDKEIERADKYVGKLLTELDSCEYKSSKYLVLRDKIDCFDEFMELFGYAWCGDCYIFCRCNGYEGEEDGE